MATFPTVNTLFLPLFLVLALVTSLGVGLWLSAMNVQFRDIKYAVPFLVQFWMYASPVGFFRESGARELARRLRTQPPWWVF